MSSHERHFKFSKPLMKPPQHSPHTTKEHYILVKDSDSDNNFSKRLSTGQPKLQATDADNVRVLNDPLHLRKVMPPSIAMMVAKQSLNPSSVKTNKAFEARHGSFVELTSPESLPDFRNIDTAFKESDMEKPEHSDAQEVIGFPAKLLSRKEISMENFAFKEISHYDSLSYNSNEQEAGSKDDYNAHFREALNKSIEERKTEKHIKNIKRKDHKGPSKIVSKPGVFLKLKDQRPIKNNLIVTAKADPTMLKDFPNTKKIPEANEGRHLGFLKPAKQATFENKPAIAKDAKAGENLETSICAQKDPMLKESMLEQSNLKAKNAVQAKRYHFKPKTTFDVYNFRKPKIIAEPLARLTQAKALLPDPPLSKNLLFGSHTINSLKPRRVSTSHSKLEDKEGILYSSIPQKVPSQAQRSLSSNSKFRPVPKLVQSLLYGPARRTYEHGLKASNVSEKHSNLNSSGNHENSKGLQTPPPQVPSTILADKHKESFSSQRKSHPSGSKAFIEGVPKFDRRISDNAGKLHGSSSHPYGLIHTCPPHKEAEGNPRHSQLEPSGPSRLSNNTNNSILLTLHKKIRNLKIELQGSSGKAKNPPESGSKLFHGRTNTGPRNIFSALRGVVAEQNPRCEPKAEANYPGAKASGNAPLPPRRWAPSNCPKDSGKKLADKVERVNQ